VQGRIRPADYRRNRLDFPGVLSGFTGRFLPKAVLRSKKHREIKPYLAV
jgi:hypothetical protein